MQNNTLKKEDNLKASERFKATAKSVYIQKDGKLNKVSLGLSIGILAGLIALTGFTVYKTSPTAITDSFVEGLETDEARMAIQQAFISGIDEYLNGNLTESELRERLYSELAKIIEKDGAFTDDQKIALEEMFAEYIMNLDIENLISKNEENITNLTNEFNKYKKENERVIETLRESLEKEIQTNKEYTQEQLDILNELHETLVKTEASHYSELQTKIQDTYNELYKLQQDQLYKGVAAWDKTKVYDIDSYVIYNDKLYRNATGTSTENPPSQDRFTEQNPTGNWEQVSVMKTVQDNFNTFVTNLYNGMTEWDEAGSYTPNSYVFYHNKIYKNITGSNSTTTPDQDTVNWQEASIMTVINNTYNTFVATVGASDYDPNKSYNAGDYVVYNNITYKNVSDNPNGQGGAAIPGVKEGAGTQSVWIPVTLTEMIDNNYQTFIKTVGAVDWNPDKSYQAGEYVIYKGNLYRNKTGVNTTPAKDSENWSQVSITDSIESLSDRVQSLELKTASDLDSLKKGLLDFIDGNMSLDASQKAALKKMIEDATDSSEAGLKSLYDRLMAAINAGDQSLAEQNAAEREKLLEQLKILNSNTASVMDSLERRIKNLEDRTTWTVNDEVSEFQYRVDDGNQGYVDGSGNWHPF
ncbi:Carbohydrate binding domain [Butyrivibrio fibrisolvens 16/4]|nr:Carbohydrate binding domain [Butyrivibrio fibrisolvens 16/4]